MVSLKSSLGISQNQSNNYVLTISTAATLAADNSTPNVMSTTFIILCFSILICYNFYCIRMGFRFELTWRYNGYRLSIHVLCSYVLLVSMYDTLEILSKG